MTSFYHKPLDNQVQQTKDLMNDFLDHFGGRLHSLLKTLRQQKKNKLIKKTKKAQKNLLKMETLLNDVFKKAT